MSEQGQTGASKVALRAGVALVAFAAVVGGLFLLDSGSRYLWIKAFHVIAVISWMAGMLYLPRLFIYHFDCEPGSKQAETFALMERRLLKLIINPAMSIAWILGLYLAWDGFAFSGGWLHLKLLAVLALSATHGYFSKAVKSFAKGDYIKTPRHWRLMNEIPTVLMIVIVIMVIVKPF